MFVKPQPIRAQGGLHPPLALFLGLPTEGALAENIMYWLLCQNKTHTEEGGARVVTQAVYTALFLQLG